MEKITPFLWFDDNAEEAVRFYTSIFPESSTGRITRYDAASAEVSGRPEGSVMTVGFKLKGQEFGALNGGPMFKFTPAVSFFVRTKDVDRLFTVLSDGGEILMPLDKYPFSERYAFIKDRYGVAWQLMLEEEKPITPSLLFVGKDYGRAEAAIRFYTAVFRNADVGHIQRYEDNKVLHSSFTLEGQEFMAMDGAGEHAFGFTEAISFVINCDTQEEIDHYWNILGEGGDPRAQQCGWLKDQFGVSWQVVPRILDDLLVGEKGKQVMKTMLQMKKLDIEALKNA